MCSLLSLSAFKLFFSLLVELGLPLVTDTCNRPREEMSKSHIHKAYRPPEKQEASNSNDYKNHLLLPLIDFFLELLILIYFSSLSPHIFVTNVSFCLPPFPISSLFYQFISFNSLSFSTSTTFLPSDISIQVIIYQGGQVFSLANHLNGRVGFVATMPSTSASIFINNTQLSDTGTYQCLVNNLPDRGGRNIGVIGLTVLGK